jgi:RluA family pseudouridine synthase
VPKPRDIELGDGTRIPILYEDRTVLAIDKPAGWLLVPVHWRQTSRNLQAALESGLAAGAFWARSRNLRFLRFVHRLDAETSGVLLLARSPGAMGPLSALFEERQVEKRYLAIVRGEPRQRCWTCRLPLAEDPAEPGRMRVDQRTGRPAETMFEWLASRVHPRWGAVSLVQARPLTGRTHQIRVHLAAEGHAVVRDELYGEPGLGVRAVEGRAAGDSCRQDACTTSTLEEKGRQDARTTSTLEESGRRDARTASQGRRTAEPTGRQTGFSASLGLRASALGYADPFTRRLVRIQAPCAEFLKAFGFAPDADRRAA